MPLYGMNSVILPNNANAKDFVAFMQQAFNSIDGFQEEILIAKHIGKLLDLTFMSAILVRMPQREFMLLYRAAKGVGFAPNLLTDAEFSPKERMRVASFLVRHFMKYQRDLSAVL